MSDLLLSFHIEFIAGDELQQLVGPQGEELLRQGHVHEVPVQEIIGRVVKGSAHHGLGKLTYPQTVLRMQPDKQVAAHSSMWRNVEERECAKGEVTSPVPQEGATSVFDILQLQEAGADQEGLNVLLVDGHVAAVCEVDQRFQSAECTQTNTHTDRHNLLKAVLRRLVRCQAVSDQFAVPGVHSLHEYLVLFTLHHIIGEHGMKVRDGGRQHDAVGAEFVLPRL